ncbi:MAG: pilus assembly protein PilM [Bacteriovorax sp.]|jgi:general secretion pathway protein L|nr:pilus assembly protein PilM [Bacteriovorax sp.]
MNILAIDVGSYSIKFVEVRPERKNLFIVEKQEIILEEAKVHYPHAISLIDLQKEIVASFIQKKANDLKIIFQVPNEMLTTRYLEIPGTSKRKTEQMIPFQLDENLPYSLGSAHFSSRLHKHSGGFSVLSNITQLNLFKEFFGFFENKEAQPSVLTSEVSTMQAYVDHIRMNDTCCILDLGHKTTKAYFIQDRQVVSNHTSFVAGSTLNEVISKTYQISPEDAVIYKHENAFLLTDEQMSDVSNEQREFALLMKQMFNPLITDIKRWEIGHRVKFGTNIKKIYLFGGTSQINGLDNFLHYNTDLIVESLPPLLDFKNDYFIHEKSFYLVKMMAISQRLPSNLINFLTGKFQTASNAFISLHSAIFLWVRSTFIALLLILGLVSERFFFLTKAEKALDAKISGLLKTPSLEINLKDRKLYATKPISVLSTLKKKNKVLKDEVSSILSSHRINALRPLAVLSKSMSANPLVSLEKFSSDEHSVSATFSSEDPAEIEKMSNHLKTTSLPDLKQNFIPGQNILTIEFSDRE